MNEKERKNIKENMKIGIELMKVGLGILVLSLILGFIWIVAFG